MRTKLAFATYRVSQRMLSATINSDVLRRVFATLFGVSLLCMLIAGALELGAWRHNQTVRGPFKFTEGSKAIVQPLAAPFFPGLSSGGDTNEQPRRSRLKASINEAPLWPPHTLHAELISEGEGRYSHWGDTLVFSLPSNTQNTESTILQIHYFWRLTSAAWWIIAGGLGSF